MTPTADILIVGAGGQLGTALAGLAPTACALSRADLDITDPEAVLACLRQNRPKVVLNAAAYTAVDKAESEEKNAFAVNALGPKNLATACARIDAVLIHVSTDYVFAGDKQGPYLETDAVGPLGAYGRSKLAGEWAVACALPRHVILRTSWVWGESGHNFVKSMLRLAQDRPQLTVVDDQRGRPTFAGDLAAAMTALGERLKAAPAADPGFGLFHATGGGDAVSWCGFARKIMEIAAHHAKPSVSVDAIASSAWPTAARRPANSVLSCQKLAAVHGLSLRGWHQALAEVLPTL